MNFLNFKAAISNQFSIMSRGDLYTVDIDKDLLWQTYLNSFPEGTNPIYRERTEHDCSCCRHFIKTVGGVVSIAGNNLVSIWDIGLADDDWGYQHVANSISPLIKSHTIDNIFLHTQHNIGTDKNFEKLDDNIKTWEHFFVTIQNRNVRGSVYPKDQIGTQLSTYRATHDVMLRGLSEITTDAIDTVLDLISTNSLYRGEENKFVVESFSQLKRQFDIVMDKEIFVWHNMMTVPESISRIRNTSIGTLLVDLSDGMGLESAVKSFIVMFSILFRFTLVGLVGI